MRNDRFENFNRHRDIPREVRQRGARRGSRAQCDPHHSEKLLVAASFAVGTGSALVRLIANREDIREMSAELLRGDPDLSHDSPNENLSDAQNDVINTIISAPSVAVGSGLAPAAPTVDQFPVKNAQQLFTKFVLDSAGKEADDHVSRATNKIWVTEYLNLFGLDFADENGKPYPYCAAGLGFAACIGYCNMAPTKSFGDPPTDVFRKVVPVLKANYFLPHPSCLNMNMVSDAKAKGRWIEGHTTIPQSGWLVFYNWDGETDPPMHVGIVQEAGQ